jgi:hypothetical protein
MFVFILVYCVFEDEHHIPKYEDKYTVHKYEDEHDIPKYEDKYTVPKYEAVHTIHNVP